MPREFVQHCRSIDAKRARTVIDHILVYGIVNNDELRIKYGYLQGARAARDVREQGIPLVSHKVTSLVTGRTIAAYTFGSPDDIRRGRFGGRRALPKSLKEDLLARDGARDAITSEPMDPRFLQVDHRIPYEIDGDPAGAVRPEDFMLIDASTQRTKSTACERCPNWKEADPAACRGCYWAFPETYQHIATRPIRREVVVWRDDEVEDHAALLREAERAGLSLSELIKARMAPKDAVEVLGDAIAVLRDSMPTIMSALRAK